MPTTTRTTAIRIRTRVGENRAVRWSLRELTKRTKRPLLRREPAVATTFTSKEDLLKGKTEMPIIKGNTGILEDLEDYVSSKTKNRNVYVETYGCQMNANDSEVMMSVLSDNGFT